MITSDLTMKGQPRRLGLEHLAYNLKNAFVRAKMSFSKYKPAPLATLPRILDPAEYDVSPETRKAQVERMSIRARLKREYLLQYNDPKRQTHIKDPALIRWTYARSANVYPNFRPTPKSSLLGAVAGLGPLFFWYYVFKTDRDRKERLIQEGRLDRKFSISY